jgi:hypothetical protein
MAQLYLQASGSLFVAFYDSQSYGGDIITGLDGELLFHHLSTIPPSDVNVM